MITRFMCVWFNMYYYVNIVFPASISSDRYRGYWGLQFRLAKLIVHDVKKLWSESVLIQVAERNKFHRRLCNLQKQTFREGDGRVNIRLGYGTTPAGQRGFGVREGASERVSEWVSEWVTEWVSEWVSECVCVGGGECIYERHAVQRVRPSRGGPRGA